MKKRRRPTTSSNISDLRDILEKYEKYFSVSINCPKDRENFERAIELLNSIESSYDSLCDEIRNIQYY